MSMNIPLFLSPSGKDYIWGGRRLNTEFNKGIDMSPLAETWECSTHPDGPSYVVGGGFDGGTLSEVLNCHPDLLGTKYDGISELPILVKFIDAEKDLSVQVHPTDEFAKEFENGQLGKTEMWYVLDASDDASLVYGFSKDVDEETVRDAIEKGSLMEFLQKVPVKKGDYFFIEAGTVHAIGSGCLIAEIQENSNLTYRLYDYNRTGKDGKKRELHVDKALRVANLKASVLPNDAYNKASVEIVDDIHLCGCKYFDVSIMTVDGGWSKSYQTEETAFGVLLCIGGRGMIQYGAETIAYKKGDCIFVPANSVECVIIGEGQFLDIKG